MNKVLFVTAVIILGASTLFAQTPYIGVFFNSGYHHEAKRCAGAGVLDTFYVAAVDFDCLLSGAEFAVHYPPAVTWIMDLATPPVTLNSTPTGISMGFPAPRNGYNPVPLCEVLVMWNCGECVEPFIYDTFRVIPNPGTGFLGAVDYPGFNLVPGVGMTTLFCLMIPTEDTTWGEVKVLYAE